MKPMSKFFLIVSAAIAFIGGVMLIIGSCSAKAQGIQLFPKKTDGKYIYTVDLENTEVSKIALDVTDADINVYTNQETEYIEFVNFNENYYSVSTTNRVVSFDEYVNLSSVFSFWDQNFSFKGMRSFFSLLKKIDRNKEINIYISDDRDINIFDFKLDKGSVTISNIDTFTDYKLTVGTGDVILKNIKTKSALNISANDCKVSIENCEISTFVGDFLNLNMQADITNIDSFTLNSKSGQASCKFDFSSEKAYISAKTNGAVLLNGETQNSPYKNITDQNEITDEYSTADISGESLNIYVEYNFNNKNKENSEETN